jgi:hypothetical protein
MPTNTNSPPSPTLSRSSTLVTQGKSRTYVFKCMPSRIAVGMLSPLLLLTSLAMVVGGSLLANKLEKHMSPVQRLAIGFQIFNYLFVAAAAIVGLHTVVRLSHRAGRLFVALIMGQLPFGIGFGALCIHVVFKATHHALATSLSTVAAASQALDAATAAPSGAPPAATPAAGADVPAAPPAAVEGDAEAPLAARNDGAGGQCPTLEGTGLVWMCEKTTLLKALIVLTYMFLWILEFVTLYAGIQYNKQLRAAQMIKVTDDEDDIYANA